MATHKKKTKAEIEQIRKNEYDLHKEQIDKLEKAIMQENMNIKYTEKELHLLKEYDVSLFEKREPEFIYEHEDSFLAFLKEMKIEGMTLGLSVAKEKHEKTERSLALERAIVKVLEDGKDFYGMSEEDLLKY